ncbi:MAG TPA: RidA family protein [Rhodothermales bacterium]
MSRAGKTPEVPRSRVRTPQAPAAIGPYSQAVLVGDTLYTSGQIPIDPETGSLVEGPIEQQTERVLENLAGVLRAAGMDFANVVQCRVYLTDINDYAAVNEVYARYFSESPPAREAVQVLGLPRGSRIEIACVAVR